VGTPPNIVAGAMMHEAGLESFTLFDFTPIGLLLLAMGVVFMTTIGRRLLPTRHKEDGPASARDLARTYRLQDELFTIHVPEDSHLDGHSLRETRLGQTLSIEVLAIRRGAERIYAPDWRATLRGGDVLLVKGKRELIEDLAGVRGIELRTTNARALPGLTRGVSGVRATLARGSECSGRTLSDLRFRERFGLTVVGIVRSGELLMENLRREVLREGDEIVAVGARSVLETFSREAGFTEMEIGFRALGPLRDKLFVIHIRPQSSMDGQTIRETRAGERFGLTVGGLIRDRVTRLAVSPDERLKSGDELLVAGEPWRLLGLVELGGALLEDGTPDVLDESGTTAVVEVAVAPRSSLSGNTLEELHFRAQYGLQVLSIWSAGQSYVSDLTHRRLAFGDALLLQGPSENIARLGRNPDFLVLSHDVPPPRRSARAPVALGGLLLMIGMVVSGFQPIHVAAFTAASLTVLGGALRMEEAYRAIEWRAIFLVAAVLPVGIAMERSGAALFLANSLTDMTGPLGPHAVLAALVVLSSLLSQGLDGAPAVVLLTPVVLVIATKLGLNPSTLMMGISLAASAAFMTPFSHKANLLVMGAGAYRSTDYLRVGALLTVVVLVTIVIAVPLLFPF
jgi:di/tricarboxylate transporter